MKRLQRLAAALFLFGRLFTPEYLRPMNKPKKKPWEIGKAKAPETDEPTNDANEETDDESARNKQQFE